MDIKKTKTNQFKKRFFAAPHPVDARQTFKKNFYPETRVVGGREYGYVRLFSFEVKNEKVGQFVKEVQRVITAGDFPQEGLILDVRGNPGGNIRAGERLLQLFTPRRIKPEPFEFINTTLNLEICQRAAKSYNLARWIPSISESVRTGAIYSMGFPLQSEELSNALGQAYHGPVILITDALSYSTTDIFAAGFQDHQIGQILGTSDNTGAGGANKWKYDELVKVLGRWGKSKFKPLPSNASFDLALRRSVRVGKSEGRPLEELGINPDHRHYMTRNDLMKHNVDMVRHAAGILAARPQYHLSVQADKGKNRMLRITASSKVRPRDRRKRISRVDIFIDGRPRKSLNARNGNISPTKVTIGKSQKFDWLVQAFDYDDNLVAAARRQR
ncbi:MAG TPA: S41 family peptidase [Pyrinomonadaceae bacterium]|nr:S41 family peptidase [Pyrinomonadaceae bacterium]